MFYLISEIMPSLKVSLNFAKVRFFLQRIWIFGKIVPISKAIARELC